MAEIVLEEAREIGTAIAAPIKSMLPVPVGAGGIQPIEGEVIPAGSRMPATQKDSQLAQMFKQFLVMIKKMIDNSKEQTKAIEQNTDELKEVAKPDKERDPTKALGQKEVDRLRTERKTELGFIADAQAELDEMSPEEARGERGESLKRQIDTRKENVEGLERTITDAGFAVEELKEGVADMKTPLGDVYNALGEIALLPDRLFGDTLKAFDKMTGNVFGLNEAYENMKKSVKGLIKEGFETLKFKAMDFGKKGLERLKEGFTDFSLSTDESNKSFGRLIGAGAKLAKSFLALVAANLLAIATSPHAMLGIAIVALVASFVFFKDELTKFFTVTIPEKFNAMIDGIANFFTETIPNFFKDLFNDIYMAIPSFLGGASDEEEKKIMEERGRREMGMPTQAQFAEVGRQRQEELGGEGQLLVRSHLNKEMQTGRKKEMLAELTTQRAADAGLTPPINIVKGGNIVQNAQSNLSMNRNINDPESLEMAYRMREFGAA